MTQPDHPRPRLEFLRRELAATIPCIGDDAQARDELRAKSLPDLLIVYVNWMSRLVPARPRWLQFASGFWTERALAHERAIYDLVGTIRRGEDVTPWLSKKASTHGYTSRAGRRRRGPEWGDKDYALNAFEAHHLHLKPSQTSALLYVLFSRDGALAVLLGDHGSFDDGSLEEAVLRARVEHDYMVMRGAFALARETTPAGRNVLGRHGIGTMVTVNGNVVMSHGLSTAGTSSSHGMQAMKIIRSLEAWDSLLDDDVGKRELLGEAGLQITTPEWAFWYTDLCIKNQGSNSWTLLLPGAL